MLICIDETKEVKISCECCRSVEFQGRLCVIEYYHNVSKFNHEWLNDEHIIDSDGNYIRNECWVEYGKEERIVKKNYLCRKCLINELEV